MAVGYVEYVESSPGAPDVVTLTRLAGALSTSARDLLGWGVDVPPGRGSSAAHPVLKELPAEECWAKLARGGIRRVALSTDSGPVVLPVNYRVHDGTVVYRTGTGSTPAGAADSRVGFEVDHIDEALGRSEERLRPPSLCSSAYRPSATPHDPPHSRARANGAAGGP